MQLGIIAGIIGMMMLLLGVGLIAGPGWAVAGGIFFIATVGIGVAMNSQSVRDALGREAALAGSGRRMRRAAEGIALDPNADDKTRLAAIAAAQKQREMKKGGINWLAVVIALIAGLIGGGIIAGFSWMMPAPAWFNFLASFVAIYIGVYAGVNGEPLKAMGATSALLMLLLVGGNGLFLVNKLNPANWLDGESVSEAWQKAFPTAREYNEPWWAWIAPGANANAKADWEASEVARVANQIAERDAKIQATADAAIAKAEAVAKGVGRGAAAFGGAVRDAALDPQGGYDIDTAVDSCAGTNGKRLPSYCPQTGCLPMVTVGASAADYSCVFPADAPSEKREVSRQLFATIQGCVNAGKLYSMPLGRCVP
jgi:hypothetical protein